MDVLLINPPWVKENFKNIWRKVASCMPPLGIAYIAACLEREGVDVEISDLQAERVSVAETRSRIAQYKQPAWIGITATTPLIYNALEIAEICKNLFPDSKVVFGGVHPTVMCEEVLSNENVDYVVRGEGEETFSQLVKGASKEKISGLSYKVSGEIIHNESRPVIENLDSLPFPAYHLLPMARYYPALGAYKRLPAISMLTTRGCPGKCTFCYGAMFGRKIRAMSPRRIVDNILLLKQDYGIREISFYDDTFTTFKKKVRKLCQIIINEKIDLTWSCFSRVDCVDLETLRMMKSAGCHQIMYGIESADEAILKNINKKTNLGRVKEAIALTKKAKIDVRAAFMLGSPGETLQTMRATMRFAIDLEPDLVVFNITTPYPGTQMFQWAKAMGYLKTFDWTKYDLATPVMELPTVDAKQVEHCYRIAHRHFYLRFPYLVNRLTQMRSVTDLMMNLKSFMALVGNR